MNVVVTGAGGFVGSHLAERLVMLGHNVTGIIRRGGAVRWPVANTTILDCGMESPEDLEQVVSSADIIYHLAGVTKARSFQGYFEGNVILARNLVSAIKRYGKKVRGVVGISSQSASGPYSGSDGLKESMSAKPVSGYGKAKLESEKVLLQLKKIVPVSIVRPPMVYGPRDTTFLPLYSGARRGLFPVFGYRKNTLMSIVYVHDLIQGLVSLGDELWAGDILSGSVYFVSGQVTTWEELGKIIGKAVGCSQIMIPMPLWCIGLVALINSGFYRLGFSTNHLVLDKWREIKQPGWVCSHAKATTDFGYTPNVGLEEGMYLTVDWCRRNRLL